MTDDELVERGVELGRNTGKDAVERVKADLEKQCADDVASALFGVPENAGKYQSWSPDNASVAPATFTMRMLEESMRRIQADFPPRPAMMLLPPKPVGTNQKARRKRRVRLRNGMMLELPPSIHPYEFQLSSEEAQNWLLARALGVPEPVGMLDVCAHPPQDAFGIRVHVSRAVPPGAVYMVNMHPPFSLTKLVNVR